MGTDEKSPKESLLSPPKEPGISSLAWQKLYFNNKCPIPKKIISPINALVQETPEEETMLTPTTVSKSQVGSIISTFTWQ